MKTQRSGRSIFAGGREPPCRLVHPGDRATLAAETLHNVASLVRRAISGRYYKEIQDPVWWRKGASNSAVSIDACRIRRCVGRAFNLRFCSTFIDLQVSFGRQEL